MNDQATILEPPEPNLVAVDLNILVRQIEKHVNHQITVTRNPDATELAISCTTCETSLFGMTLPGLQGQEVEIDD